MPKVSVIIPTYNYGQYIERAIDSVLAQSYKDVEILVVDDGSTDNTREIIEAKYGNSVKYYYQDNQGAPGARNKGITESHGEYLAFLDADDFFYPDNLEKKVTALNERKMDAFVYSDGYYKKENNSEFVKSSSWIFSAAGAKLSGDIFLKLLEGYRIETSSALFRRAFVIKIEGFDQELLCLQDYDLFLRISFNGTCSFIDECLFESLKHSESLSSSTSKVNTNKSKAMIIDVIEHRYSRKAELLGRKWAKILATRDFLKGSIAYSGSDYGAACNHYAKSITTYPFQKRVYLSLLMALVKKLLYQGL